MSPDLAPIRITITPEPTPEEFVAITAAVTAAIYVRQPTPAPELPHASRWSRQGRLEATRPLDRDDDLS